MGFKTVIHSGKYEERRLAANQYAWDTLSLNAVPSYRMGERILKTVENIGVDKKVLTAFLGPE